MINNKNFLTDTIKFNVNIYFANGGHVRSELKGKFVGYFNNNKIILNNVLYVPEFKRNLMSIDHLSSEYYKTVFYRYKIKTAPQLLIVMEKEFTYLIQTPLKYTK